MASTLVELGRYAALDTQFLNTGGPVVRRGRYVYSIGRNIPSPPETYVAPANTGNSFGVLIFDIANLAAITRTYESVFGAVTFYPGEARGANYFNGWLVVTTAGAVVLLDVDTTPGNPVELGRLVDTNISTNPRSGAPEFFDPATSILWAGLDTFNSFTNDGILGVTVPTPSTMTNTPGRIPTDNANSIGQTGQSGADSWGGRYIAAVDYDAFAVYGVRLWDVQNTALKVMATWPSMGGSDWPIATQHFVVGGVDYIWTTLRFGGSRLHNVSNPAVPVQVAFTEPQTINGGTLSSLAMDVVPWAPWLIVAVWSDSDGRHLALYDFAVPTLPVRRYHALLYSGGSLTTTNMTPTHVYCDEDRAFITDPNGRMRVYQITEVDPPVGGILSVA